MMAGIFARNMDPSETLRRAEEIIADKRSATLATNFSRALGNYRCDRSSG